MSRQYANPPWEQTNIVLISASMVRESVGQLLACEKCSPRTAKIPFDWVLDQVIGNDVIVTDYVLTEWPKCPRCSRTVNEKTLVEWGGDSVRYM